MIYHDLPWFTMIYHDLPWFTMIYLLNMVMFHDYVSLPEAKFQVGDFSSDDVDEGRQIHFSFQYNLSKISPMGGFD